jgi:hypothetical protein
MADPGADPAVPARARGADRGEEGRARDSGAGGGVTEKAVILWGLLFLSVVGFLWAVAAPECFNTTFVYPSIFAAGCVGYLSGQTERRASDGFANLFELTLRTWIHGWVGLIFGVVATGIGWFVGALFCINVLPVFGLNKCVAC